MKKLEGVKDDMIANNLQPFEPVHPGPSIKEEIEFRGISQRQLAKEMDVSYSVLNEVLNGKRPVTTEYALLLEAALSIDADIWIHMQADYDKQMAQNNKPFAKKLEQIRKFAAML